MAFESKDTSETVERTIKPFRVVFERDEKLTGTQLKIYVEYLTEDGRAVKKSIPQTSINDYWPGAPKKLETHIFNIMDEVV
ncbi:MAG: hypothetical protein V3T23_10200 [Nitrososphaerales archaeon]